MRPGGNPGRSFWKRRSWQRSRRAVFLFLIEVEELAGIDLQGAGELKDIVEADILLSALHFSNEITVDLYHLAKRFLGQMPFRAYGTQACAER
jgi:hypothetical protein